MAVLLRAGSGLSCDDTPGPGTVEDYDRLFPNLSQAFGDEASSHIVAVSGCCRQDDRHRSCRIGLSLRGHARERRDCYQATRSNLDPWSMPTHRALLAAAFRWPQAWGNVLIKMT